MSKKKRDTVEKPSDITDAEANAFLNDDEPDGGPMPDEETEVVATEVDQELPRVDFPDGEVEGKTQTYKVLSHRAFINDLACNYGDEIELTHAEATKLKAADVRLELVVEH